MNTKNKLSKIPKSKVFFGDKYCDLFLKDTKFLFFCFAPMLSQIKLSMKLPARIEQYLQDCYSIMSGFEDGMKPSEEFCSSKLV